jgi:hypothetical protein
MIHSKFVAQERGLQVAISTEAVEVVMPTVRKLTDDEIQALEARDQRRGQRQRRVRAVEAPIPTFAPQYLTTRPHPRIGDIVRIVGHGEDQCGIVVRLSTHDEGWDGAELLVGEELQWFDTSAIGAVLGRPRGISRIDQPRRRTHGWFVRLYDGSMTRLARMFSDQKHLGIGRALKEALAFHSANDHPRDRELGVAAD